MKQELHPHSNNINVTFAMPKSAIVELGGFKFLAQAVRNAKACFLYNTVPCIT
jgi:hypothetical protein